MGKTVTEIDKQTFVKVNVCYVDISANLNFDFS